MSIEAVKEILDRNFAITRRDERATVELPDGRIAEVHVVTIPFEEKKTRVYVNGTEPEMEQPPNSILGEDPELDAQWRKYNREEIRLMREAAQATIDAIGWDAGKLSFSRKAGCSCPCSPGFISQAYGSATLFIKIQK